MTKTSTEPIDFAKKTVLAIIGSLALTFFAVVGNFLLQLFSWDADNLPLTHWGYICFSLLCLFIICFLFYVALKSPKKTETSSLILPSTYKQKNKSKKAKETRKTLFDAASIKERAKENRTKVVLASLTTLVILFIHYKSTVNYINYKETASLIKAYNDYSSSFTYNNKTLDNEYWIIMDAIQGSPGSARDNDYSQRIKSSLERIKNNSGLPVTITSLGDISITTDSLAKLDKNIYLISGSLDEFGASITIDNIAQKKIERTSNIAEFLFSSIDPVLAASMDRMLVEYAEENGVDKPSTSISKYFDTEFNRRFHLSYSIPKEVEYMTLMLMGSLMLKEIEYSYNRLKNSESPDQNITELINNITFAISILKTCEASVIHELNYWSLQPKFKEKQNLEILHANLSDLYTYYSIILLNHFNLTSETITEAKINLERSTYHHDQAKAFIKEPEQSLQKQLEIDTQDIFLRLALIYLDTSIYGQQLEGFLANMKSFSNDPVYSTGDKKREAIRDLAILLTRVNLLGSNTVSLLSNTVEFQKTLRDGSQRYMDLHDPDSFNAEALVGLSLYHAVGEYSDSLIIKIGEIGSTSALIIKEVDSLTDAFERISS